MTVPLADVAALKAEPGHLTIPLDQWVGLKVTHKGKSVIFPAAEIFAILKEGQE